MANFCLYSISNYLEQGTYLPDSFYAPTPRVPVVNYMYDVCHEKTDLKVFVIVIPKEGWARVTVPTFFWYDTNFLEFESFDFIDHIL